MVLEFWCDGGGVGPGKGEGGEGGGIVILGEWGRSSRALLMVNCFGSA